MKRNLQRCRTDRKDLEVYRAALSFKPLPDQFRKIEDHGPASGMPHQQHLIKIRVGDAILYQIPPSGKPCIHVGPSTVEMFPAE